MKPPGTTELMMIPGPTPLPDSVRSAMGHPAIGHRGAGFKAVMKRVLPGLQWAFQTEQDVLLYTASGTGAGEAAIINTLNHGDRVLGLVCGVFSQRWVEVAKSLGIQVDVVSALPGEPNTVESLKAALANGPQYKMVMMTHSETSTGVLNPVKDLVAVAREYGALTMVDVVTSLGCTPFEFDGWGVDLALSGSQKGFMIPPGLSFLAVSERAWKAHETIERPGFYFNFKRNQKAQQEFTTAFTPATHLILALDKALELMQAEGLHAIQHRHRTLRDQIRHGVRQLGLELVVPNDDYASWAVTAVHPPVVMDVPTLREQLRDRFGIVVADGQKELKGKIFRIGHLGHVGEREVVTVLNALQSLMRVEVATHA